MVVTSKLRRHKVMERAMRALMGNNLPPRFKFKDTYDSIEVPTAYQQHLPSQATLEAKFDELIAEEDVVAPTTQIKADMIVSSNLEVGTSNLFVDTETGNVGIGTDSPAYTLDVHGSSNVGALTATSLSGDGSGLSALNAGNISSGTLGRPISTTTGVFTSTGNAVLVGPSGGGQVGLTINDGDGNTNITFNHASLVPDQNGSSGRIDCGVDGTSAYMRLRVKDNVTGGTNTGNLPDCVRIEEGYVRAYSNLYVGGNFGIGTTSPLAPLDIGAKKGSILSTSLSSLTSNASVRITGITEPADALCIGMLGTDTGGDTGNNPYAYIQNIWDSTPATGRTLLLNPAGGNVGIGTTSPGYKLHVNGDIYATGNITGYSDKRAKSDIQKIENALDKIDKLNGYTFTMNDKRYTGVIAQEVLPVLPEAVTGSEETHYAVAYGNMMGLIIEAIKELKEKIG